MTNGHHNITNQHNHVGADTIRPRNLHNLIATHFVGYGDSTHRCRDSGMKSSKKLVLQTVGANFVRLSKIRTNFRPRTS